jgi:DNA polymerase II small subunit/DNA polymerase delta subunit B
MIIISFFRDFLNGWIYVLYVIICVIAQLALFGIIADRKRKVIEEGLLEKRQRDIESGAEAEKAALADKQVLDIYDEFGNKIDENGNIIEKNPNAEDDEEEDDTDDGEEVPQVLVIGEGEDEENK